MAINTNPGSPLRHVATFTSSGTFLAPAGANLAFVSVVGAGSGGSGGGRYDGGRAGHEGGVAGAYVQIVGGGNHIVTIGAGGTGGDKSSDVRGVAGGTGGTTIFDGRLQFTGTGQNNPGQSRYASSSAVSGASSGSTALTTINPGPSTLISTGTITTQSTGGSAGGNAGPQGQSANSVGGAGSSGRVHIYI